MRDFLYRVRGVGYRCEWGWAIEANPRGTGHHMHAVQHGDYIPQDRLTDLWGGRITDIRALRQPAVGVYAIKEALRVAGYVTKGGAIAHLDHLDRNGGRAVHFSRGYLHGLTTREAFKEIAKQMNPDQPERSWRLEIADGLRS